MGIGIGQILLLLIIVLLIFGAGKLPSVMSDIAKGMRAFKQGLNEEDASAQKPNLIEATPVKIAKKTKKVSSSKPAKKKPSASTKRRSPKG